MIRAGFPPHHDVRRYVFVTTKRLKRDDDVIADGYAVINDGSSAYPDVIR